MLSQYKNIFGAPRTGAHAYRFLDTAIVDFLMSIIIAIIITYITKIPLVLTTVAVLITGTLAHILFGVETNTTKYLGF